MASSGRKNSRKHSLLRTLTLVNNAVRRNSRWIQNRLFQKFIFRMRVQTTTICPRSFFLIPYSVVWNSNCDHRSCFLIEMRVKLKPLQHVLAFYKFACQLHDVACQVSERRCFSTHPGDEYNNDPTFTSRKLVAARWNHWRKKLGPNIGRASVHENKNQTFVVFFCRSGPLLIFLELFLTFLFLLVEQSKHRTFCNVGFGVCAACGPFSSLAAQVWTCRLNLAVSFKVLFFCNSRFDGCFFYLISSFIHIYFFLFIYRLSFALLFLSPGSKCTYCSCEFRALDPIKSLTLPIIWIPWKRLDLHVLTTIKESGDQWWWPNYLVLRFS